VPRGRGAAEAGFEALEEGFGEGDFGEQDEGLFAGAEGGSDGFEIDFGLARSGDSVEQDRVEAGGSGEGLRGRLLVGGESGLGEVGVGDGERSVGLDLHCLERAGIDQPAQHGVADLGDIGQFADRALAAG